MGFEAYTSARDAQLRNGERARAESLDMQDRSTRQQAGNALATGDYAGASNALFAGGDLTNGIAVQNAQRTRQTGDREQRQAAIAAAVSGLLHVPQEQRAAMLQSRIAPLFHSLGMGDYLTQITPEDLSDDSLRGLATAMGGKVEEAPSGYQYAPGGRLQAIPGGPQDPANQRPIITPFGIMLPPGAQMPAMPGQALASAQPQTLGSTIPPGWSAAPPRPNQPARGQPERAQPVGVSYRSPEQARSQIASLVPGVGFTSGTRTPEHNRAVGGVPTSNHVRGRAWDLVPPRGMSMAQLAAKMQQSGLRVLNEGDHVHVSW